jgi:hypothetical protein
MEPAREELAAAIEETIHSPQFVRYIKTTANAVSKSSRNQNEPNQ